MTYRPKGKHVSIDTSNPEGLGICDKTGFVFKRKDMVKQLEWRGNRLMWTGFIVGRPYADDPNPQLKPPILPPDPVPLINPRPPFYSGVPWNMQGIPWNFQSTPWNMWGGGSFVSQEINFTTVGTISNAPFDLDVPALTPAQRLTQLDQAYFGAYQ